MINEYEQQIEGELTLSLEEWHSLDRQIKNLTARKKDLETQLAKQFQTKDGQLSTIHNVDNFKITKKEGFKYTLNKKQFNDLTEDEQNAIMALGAVSYDIKASEAKVRELAPTEGNLLQKCFSSKEVSEIKIEFKGE